MVPIKVVLAVQDDQYIEPFLHYVHSSEYSDRLRISAFSHIDSFIECISGTDKPDFIVAESHFVEQMENEGSSLPYVMLSESDKGTTQGKELNKYQPLNLLLDAVIEAYKGQSSIVRASNERKAAIIAVYSAIGGSGKTTVALNMAKQLGFQGLNVFYLNLETVNSAALYSLESEGSRTGKGLSRLLYDLTAAEEGQDCSALSVQPYVVTQEALRSDIFEPLGNLKELLQMNKEDTVQLLNLIATNGSYDVVIVDVDSLPHERVDAVLEHCDDLIWLLLDDFISMFKSSKWLDYLARVDGQAYARLFHKTRFIVNRYVGNLANQPPHADMIVSGVLPYIPSWKQVSQGELVISSPIFQREILKLCHSIIGERAGVLAGGHAP
ncbi:AAA family ATPase [Paenibacillus sediminis]|uniref:Cellulose biosynthesis protein BcsQ n=1 Tax=Paenibacillus sediminis TaxID=664909 RepID=A0ABS4H4G2_9BACL|nr:AAA family ATPase [Paenibacillus sediminis]MBP1937430.1 cellulose biosynthesis protein BcsQ [Paenibacillus sediminis]